MIRHKQTMLQNVLVLGRTKCQLRANLEEVSHYMSNFDLYKGVIQPTMLQQRQTNVHKETPFKKKLMSERYVQNQFEENLVLQIASDQDVFSSAMNTKVVDDTS